MLANIVEKHFVPGNKLRLEFSSEGSNGEQFEIDALITTVHGEVVIVELPSDGAATLLRSYGTLEVTIGSFGGGMYCRCIANIPNDSKEKVLLLYVEQILETVPQRREDFRADLEIPLFVRLMPNKSKEELQLFWRALVTSRQNVLKPLLRHGSDGDYVSDWEGGNRVVSQPVNLSASGIMFYCSKMLVTPLRFHADIFLPNGNTLDVVPVVGRVVRCRKLTPELEPPELIAAARNVLGEVAVYRVAATFELIGPRDQELLTRYTIKPPTR